MLERIQAAVAQARILQAAVPASRRMPPDAVGLFDVLVNHAELRAASRALFVDGHHTKAVEEGQKALVDHVQRESGLSLDGASLMRHAFSAKRPELQVNDLRTRADRDEQEGYMDIFVGIVLMARSPRVHNHRFVDSPDKALALLAFTNHLFDVVDDAGVANRAELAVSGTPQH